MRLPPYFPHKTATSPDEKRAARRHAARITLVLALAVGWRWQVANQEPVYSTDGGVYQTPVARTTMPSAAVFYEAAVESYSVTKPAGWEGDTRRLFDAPVAVQESVIAQAKPSLDLLRQGMRYPLVADYKLDWGAKGNGQDPTNPLADRDYQSVREMGYMLAVEARARASRGDNAGAIGSSLDAVRLGVDSGQGRSLLPGMVGILDQMIGTREGMRHVAKLTGGEARAAANRLEAILARERSFTQIMTADRDTIAYETLQSVFRAEILEGTNPTTDKKISLAGPVGRFAVGALIFAFTKQGLVDDFAARYGELISRASMPYQEAVRLPVLRPAANPIVRYWMLNDYYRVYFQSVRQSATNRVFLARLAVQAYKQDHNGAAPMSLLELACGARPYLDRVPADPFSPLGNAPLRYSPRTGEVYSVGENGIDDRDSGDDIGNH